MPKLAVLMYHNVHPEISEGLTISTAMLEEQFKFLSENDYRCWFFSELQSLKSLPKGKNIVITFDDAYVSQKELAIPLLKKYGLKATIFVPFKFIGKTDEWNTNSVAVMSASELNSLDPEVIELGRHSYAHINYKEVILHDVEDDLQKSEDAIRNHQLTVSPVMAYPYGKFPRKGEKKEEFFQQIEKHRHAFACRIGNRINKFPFPSPYEIQRLDIKGEYKLGKFKRKLRFGKLF